MEYFLDEEELKINDFVKTNRGKIGIITDVVDIDEGVYEVKLLFKKFNINRKNFKKIDKVKISLTPPDTQCTNYYVTLSRIDALDFIDILDRNTIKYYFL